MSAREGLIVILPESGEAEPRWLRVVEGGIVQTGIGANWLVACGLAALPDTIIVMLVPPAGLVRLVWTAHPDMPPRQGRAAARLAALSEGILPADQSFAVGDDNDDPARPHIIAVAARGDMQHWLLWAQHHGIDPDIIVPAPLLLPDVESGFSRGTIGDVVVLRGRDMALTADLAIPALIGKATSRDVNSETIDAAAIAALVAPPLDLRQGDFAKRTVRSFDPDTLKRIAVWSACILLCSLVIAVIGIVKQNSMTRHLDAQSVTLAQQIISGAQNAAAVEAEMDRLLAQRGAGGHGFTGTVAGLLTAMQDAPGVSLAALSRDPDGLVRATLAAARAEDINTVLLAIQAAGFTISATSASDPSGRVLADITVRP